MKIKKLRFLCLAIILAMLSGIFGNSNSIVLFAAEDTFDDELFYEDEDSDYDLDIEDDDEDEYESEGFVEDDEAGEEEEITDDELEDALDVLDPKEVGVTYNITSRWSGHCNVDVVLSNLTEETIENWEIEFPFEGSVENIWNAKVTKTEEGSVNIKNADWNQDIEVGKTVSFGMTVACPDENHIAFPKECSTIKEYVEVLSEYDMDLQVYSKWDNKVNGQITIDNLEKVRIEDWKIDLETNLTFISVWNAKIKRRRESGYTLDNMGYNANIEAGGSVSFTFIAEYPEGEEPNVSEYYLYEMGDVVDIEEQIQSQLEDPEEDVEYIDENDFEGEELEAFNVVKSYYARKISLSSKAAAKNKNSKPKNPYANPKNWAGKVTLKEKNHKYNVSCNTHPNLAIQGFHIYNDDLYIAQRSGTTLYINKCVKNGNEFVAEKIEYDDNGQLTSGDEMCLEGFAHGQTIEFFTDTTDENKVKLLIGGNIRKDFERSLAIVEYRKGETINFKKDNFKRLTKLAYANQKRKYFGYAGRIDASLSPDKKTLCIWFATDKNKKENDSLKIGKIQIACYNFNAILKKLGSDPSLSFQNIPKSYCYSSCEQNEKKQFIRPKGSNQGIAVSNRYAVTSNGKKVKKHKVYLSSGAQQSDKPLYISMMTLTRRSEKTLTSNGIYHTRLKLKCKKIAKGINKNVKKWEIEKIRLTKKNKLNFIITPAPNDKNSTISKERQYIFSIPASKMNSQRGKTK